MKIVMDLDGEQLHNLKAALEYWYFRVQEDDESDPVLETIDSVTKEFNEALTRAVEED